MNWNHLRLLLDIYAAASIRSNMVAAVGNFSGLKDFTGYLIRLSVVLITTSSTVLGADACAELADAKSFSLGKKLVAGRIISGEEAFRTVLAQSNPLGCLRKVIKTGSIESKMYALVAFREMDRREFERQIKDLRRQNFKVVTLATEERGVIEISRGVAVLNQIESGAFRPFFQYYRTGSFHWE